MFHSANPTLFGRPEGVRSETEALHSTLVELRDVSGCLQREEPHGAIDARRLLTELSAELSVYFDAEECAGYFRTIVADCPGLEPRAARIERAQDGLRDLVAAVWRMAGDARGAARLGRRIEGLIVAFEQLEHAENDLLQEFFLRDDGGSE